MIFFEELCLTLTLERHGKRQAWSLRDVLVRWGEEEGHGGCGIGAATVEDTAHNALLPRQEPIAHVSREETDAGAGKNVVAPVPIVHHTHDACCGCKGVSHSAIGIAILQSAELGATEGSGGMTRGKRVRSSCVGTRFTDGALGNLTDGRHRDVGRCTGKETVAKIMTVLHARDESERHVAAYGNILQFVVEGETALTFGTGVDEMIAHAGPAKRNGEGRESKLRGAELRCRIFGSFCNSHNWGNTFIVDRRSVLLFGCWDVCVFTDFKIHGNRIGRKLVSMRYARTIEKEKGRKKNS